MPGPDPNDKHPMKDFHRSASSRTRSRIPTSWSRWRATSRPSFRPTSQRSGKAAELGTEVNALAAW